MESIVGSDCNLMKNILVVQFRTNPDAAHAEQKDLARVAEGLVVLTFITATTDAADFATPATLLAPYDGVILGGSGDMHFDGGVPADAVARRLMYATRKRIAPLLRYIIAHDVPTLGICLGHQLLADCAGVPVRQCRKQSKTGTFTVQRCGDDDALLTHMPQVFAAQYGHKDAVTQLPKGAQVLACGPHCDYGVLRYGKRVYSTQFHPELNYETMVRRLAAYPEYIPEGSTVGAICAPSPHATKILYNFFRMVHDGV